MHTCDVCGYKSSRNTQFLEKHGLYQKKFKFNNEKITGSLCDKCGLSSDDWKLLLSHKKQHHIYSCDSCDYIAKNAQSLNLHKIAKHRRQKTTATP